MPTNNIVLLRELAACLFLLDLVAYLPYAHTCLGPGYWHGTLLERTSVRSVVYGVWVLACLSLLTSFYPLVAAAVLFPLFRRIYIKGRWKTLFRGGGAPGFMSHYTTLYILLFELARWLDASGRLSESVWTMLRVDFGVVLACSGSYKSLSGYLKSEGMEYGLANPMWGYFWPFFRRLSPRNFFLRAQDTLAALSQLCMGLLLALSPIYAPLGWLGAVMCIGTFLYLTFTVRLGRLAPLMMLLPLAYLPDLGITLSSTSQLAHAFDPVHFAEPAVSALSLLAWGYIAILPLVKAMQYTNLFLGREFPKPLQGWLTRYANWVPIIMWRVFTPDVTNFFIRIRQVNPTTNAVTTILDENTGYSYSDATNLRLKLRYMHVTESIAVTTVFTTLKYFRSKRDLFNSKLVEYARTLGAGTFEFEYVAILKSEARFEFLPVGRFRVDTNTAQIDEDKLVPAFDYGAPAAYSHIKETQGYGTYAPREPQPAQ